MIVPSARLGGDLLIVALALPASFALLAVFCFVGFAIVVV